MKTLFSGNARRIAAILAGGAVLMLMSSFATAAISTTRHNLGSSNALPVDDSGAANRFTGTAEICVFCHTPHGADTNASVPLWNRNLGTQTYQRYSSLGTTTFDAAETAIGSVSIACLSCHDGTQAMNVVLNAPGSGSVAMTGTWFGIDQTAGVMSNSTNIGYPMLGLDLRNDHPVSMQYGGGGLSNTTPAGVAGDTNDLDFAIAVNSATPALGQVGNRMLGSLRVWWVETSATTGQQKEDLTLYSRTDTTLSVNQPFVECASCHDPHSNNSTFLRILNTGSALCLTCHDK